MIDKVVDHYQIVARRTGLVLLITLGLPFVVALCARCLGKDKELKPEELVAEHIKSIGPPDILARIKSRAVTGTVTIQFFQGATGQLSGQSQIVSSEGGKLGIVMGFGALDYTREHFAFDGKNVTVGYINLGRRSLLGSFINQHNALMKEGLLGGVFSLGWSLMDLQEKQPRLKYRKSKFEGHEMHELEYRPRKGLGDFKIRMLFDLETFRHVRTEYTLRINAAMGYGPVDGKGGVEKPDSIYRLLERYDDFKEADGIMLPHFYDIEFSVEGEKTTFFARWTIEANQIIHNGQVSPQFFEAK